MLKFSVVMVCVLVVSTAAHGQNMLDDPPRELKLGLDANGNAVLPDYGYNLKNLDYQEAITTTQTPAPGTVFHGPQLVWVEVAGIDASEREDFKRFRVELVDEFLPGLNVFRQATAAPLPAPCGGHQYYLAPVQVAVLASASDLQGTQPAVRMLHNGQRYQAGTPITTIGIHVIQVGATDDSGNERWETELFEIRTRPNYPANIWVESIGTTSGPGGIEQVAITVRLTASAFQVKAIHPDSLNLWLENSDGTWIRATGGAPILVEYVDCYYRAMFFANVAQYGLAQLPPGLAVTGRNRNDMAAEFDFVATAAAQMNQDAFVPPCNDPNPIPIPDPLPCEWKTQLCTSTPQTCAWANTVDLGWSVGTSTSAMGMSVTCTDVSGSGSASLYLNPVAVIVAGFSSTVFSNCSKTNGGTMRVYLEGTDCCNNCNIHVVANPHISGSASRSGNAAATISGSISVACGCGGGASASGSATVTDGGGSTTINGVPVPLPSGATTASFAANAQPPLDTTCNTCDLSITFSTAGTINCSATVNLLPTKWWNSSASCDFGPSGPGLTVSPSVNCTGPNLPPAIEPIAIP